MPKAIIPEATNVIIAYVKPTFSKTVPNVAPRAFARLKTEAALVPDKAGASGAERMILEFKIGTKPNVPALNKKHINNAKPVF